MKYLKLLFYFIPVIGTLTTTYLILQTDLIGGLHVALVTVLAFLIWGLVIRDLYKSEKIKDNKFIWLIALFFFYFPTSVIFWYQDNH